MCEQVRCSGGRRDITFGINAREKGGVIHKESQGQVVDKIFITTLPPAN